MVTALFVSTVAAVFAGFAWAAHRVGGPRAAVATVVALGAWLVVAGALASRLGVPLVPVSVLTALAVALSPWGRRVADGVPLPALVGYQAFRMPVELTLFGLYGAGVVPVQMTFEGRNFDIVTGVTAAVLAALLAVNRAGTRLLVAWNVAGLLLLANIVAISVRSLPVNQVPTTFPWVWLPTFLVPAALFGHVLVFRVAGSASGRTARPS